MNKETKIKRSNLVEEEFYISSNIEFLRKQKKYSQEKLGELLGYNRSTIGNWESRYRIPDTVDLFRLSRIFDVSIDDLLTKNLKV